MSNWVKISAILALILFRKDYFLSSDFFWGYYPIPPLFF